MTDIQSRTETMGASTLQFLDNNNAIWTANTAMQDERDALEDKLDEINDIELIQATNITGNAAEKNTLKQTMAEKAIVVCGPLKVFARNTNNAVLLAEVDFQLSDLTQTKDSTAEDNCRIIHNRASANVAGLAPYGITPAIIGAVKTAADDFHASIGKPQAAKGVVTAATQDLETAFIGLDGILTNLDDLMNFFRFSQPTFFEGYHTARKRIDTGVRHIAAQVHLIDKITKADLDSGTLEVQPIGLSKKTGRHSTVRLFDLETGIGTFDLVAHAPHYQNATVSNIVIAEGQITRIEIEMEQE